MTNPFKKNKVVAKTTAKPALKPMVYAKSKPAGIPVSGISGYFLLFVCVSILFANYRVFFGVEELIPRIMLAPSTLAVVIFLIYKAGK